MEVYLDNAASTQLHPNVLDSMYQLMKEYYANPSSIHEAGKKAREILETDRLRIAHSFPSRPVHIIFTSGGTESNTMILRGSIPKKERVNILLSRIEHPSLLHYAKKLGQEGMEVRFIDVDKNGVVILSSFLSQLDTSTSLVSVMHANNETGVIQPIEAIQKICTEKNIPFHSDCTQSFQKIPLPVVDSFTLSSHKIHGPKGIGALVLNQSIALSPLIVGGNQEHGLRAGTENVIGIHGFATASANINTELYTKVKQLQEYFENQLISLGGVIHGTSVKRLPTLTSVAFEGTEAEVVAEHLNHHGIFVSIGSACSAHKIEESHVLKAMKIPKRLSLGTLRFSYSLFTTQKELDFTTRILSSILEDMRAIQ